MAFEIFKAIILGIVEGVTEFLPISSTGHLILVNQFLSFNGSFTQLFDVVIQFGAILAVATYFWSRLFPFHGTKDTQNVAIQLWKRIIVAVIPALILGAFLGDFIEEILFNPVVVGIALVIGGVIFLVVDTKGNSPRINAVQEISFGTAFGIGLVQCLALIPGTSRAAATIIGAIFLGASRVVAVEFSFFLAIPTMIAASVYSFLKHGTSLAGSEYAILLVGFLVSFLTALTVTKFLLQYIQSHNFKAFGYYRIALGALVLFAFFLTSIF